MARIAAHMFPGTDCAPAESQPAAPGKPPFAGLLAAYSKRDAGRYDYLLLLRFTAINLAGFALLAAAYVEGWVTAVLAADMTNLCLAIFAVFIGGLVICARKVNQTSREINQVKAIRRPKDSRVAQYLAETDGRSASARSIAASVLRLKLFSRIAVVRNTANSLVFLGLIGTVVGFIIALSGVNPSTASDPSAIGPMVATLIEGMSVALYTTLVGAVLNIWLMVNYHVLATGTVRLTTAIVELGEQRARN